MSKNRRYKNCLLFFIIVLFTITCTLVWVSQIIPARAEEEFGPVVSDLNYRERFTYSAILLWHGGELNHAINPQGEDVNFSIEYGESIYSVTQRLWDNNLITDPGLFRTYLQYSGMDKTIQAGEYLLSPRLTALEIATALQDSIPTHVTFVVLPGWRIDEIAAALPTSGLPFSADEFLSFARRPPADFTLIDSLPKNTSLEGFFYPDIYNLPREISTREFSLILVNNFDLQISQEMRQGFAHQNLDIFQSTTLASIIEREAIIEDEKPLIASVFLNRLSLGMPLESDPTVQYALGYNQIQETWWTNPLSLVDLSYDSPYNTYLYPGLPPGPIANPDKTSMNAVAFPAQTPFLYFRAMCDQSGRHVFSETYEEHINNACP